VRQFDALLSPTRSESPLAFLEYRTQTEGRKAEFIEEQLNGPVPILG
jgi:hypothetical protein